MIFKNILLEDILKQFIKKGYINESNDIIIMTVDDHNVEKSKKTSYEKLAKKDSDVLYYPLINVDILFNNAGRRMMAFITDEYKMRFEATTMMKTPDNKSNTNYIFYFYVRVFDTKFTKSYICRENFLYYKLFECLRDLGNTCVDADRYNKCSEYVRKHKKEICEMYNLFPGVNAEDIFKETLAILLGDADIRLKPATGVNLQNILIIEKL